jgi:glycogen operon protein
LSWTPWKIDKDQQEIMTFVQSLLALRASQPVLQRRTFLSGRRTGTIDVLWLRPNGAEMTAADWNDPERRTLGMLLDGNGILERDAQGELITGDTLLILLNAGVEDVLFTLPARLPSVWTCLVDSAAADEKVPYRPATNWLLKHHSSAIFTLTTSGRGARVTRS